MPPFNPEQAICDVKREFGEHGGICPSISRSATFTVMEPGSMPEIFEGLRGPDKGGCFLYSRHFNPTVDILAQYLAAMEGTEAALGPASGMPAISCALLRLCRSGDHIVSSLDLHYLPCGDSDQPFKTSDLPDEDEWVALEKGAKEYLELFCTG